MNFLARSIGNVARACLGNSIQGVKLSLPRLFVNPNIEGSLVNTTRSCLGNILQEYADIIFTYNISATGMAESAVAKHQQEYPDQTVLHHSIFQTIFRMLRETGFEQVRMGSTLLQMHLGKYNRRKTKRKNPLGGKPYAKGVVIKTMIKKPKKPNSANRKCVVVKLTTGKEMIAYVPGIGHNLQEHSVVLCRVGRLRDTPGVKIRCVRGKYDLPHPIKKTT